MDPIQLIQASIVGFLQNGQQVMNATADTNATEIAGDPTTLPPLNLSSIVSFLLSFAALRDWLKLIVIGGIIETCRRCGMRLWTTFMESFWLTACFDDSDISYSKCNRTRCNLFLKLIRQTFQLAWALYWLSKQPTWSKFSWFHIML